MLSKVRIITFLTCAMGIVACTQTAYSQSIGNWNFNSTLTGTPGLFNTASNADFAAGIPTRVFNGGTEYYGENGWPAGAVNTAMYMQFSLTPLTGYQLDISSIVLRLRRSNTGSPSGSGPTSWSLRSSLDGFTTNISAGTMTHNYADYTVTPGSSFLNIYTTVTFRLYGYSSSMGSGGTSRFVIDNIRANGIGYLLPARLGGFTAIASDTKVNLAWMVYQTEKNDSYVAERSTDGINFRAINSIEETGNVAEKKYSCTDDVSQLAVDQLYYRMRLTGNSGMVNYSPVIAVKIKSRQPAIKTSIRSQQLYINGSFPAAGNYQATMYNANGQMITRISFTAVNGYNNFVFNVNRRIEGTCIIHIGDSKGNNISVIKTIINL